jgi:hypothetical protein
MPTDANPSNQHPVHALIALCSPHEPPSEELLAEVARERQALQEHIDEVLCLLENGEFTLDDDEFSEFASVANRLLEGAPAHREAPLALIAAWSPRC